VPGPVESSKIGLVPAGRTIAVGSVPVVEEHMSQRLEPAVDHTTVVAGLELVERTIAVVQGPVEHKIAVAELEPVEHMTVRKFVAGLELAGRMIAVVQGPVEHKIAAAGLGLVERKIAVVELEQVERRTVVAELEPVEHMIAVAELEQVEHNTVAVAGLGPVEHMTVRKVAAELGQTAEHCIPIVVRTIRQLELVVAEQLAPLPGEHTCYSCRALV
jgi:hypothetical protein